MYFLAVLVASRSCPAKTVASEFGDLELRCKASLTPGRHVPAAHPQTELKTNNMVPEALGMVESTSSPVRSSMKPADVRSVRIGAQSCSG